MIKTLSSWRGIMVIVIILFHTPLPLLNHATHMGVSLFIVMSGALLSMRHGLVSCSYREWIMPRASKMYGMHWAALAFMALMQLPYGEFHLTGTLPLNIALLHPWVLDESVIFSYNIPAWFLGTLLACYALYPLLSKALARMGLRWAWTVAILLTLIQFILLETLPQATVNCLYAFPPSRLCDFFWGMTLGASLPAIDACTGKWMRSHANITELTTIIVIAATLAAAHTWSHDTGCIDVTPWIVPSSLIIVMCTMLNGSEGFVGKAMRSRPLVWLGSISLELFILAMPVAYLYSHYMAGLPAHWGYMQFYDISWPITLPLTILIAAGVHRLTKKKNTSTAA